jgi:RimJ/RimL family protein N-acetyltransferase
VGRAPELCTAGQSGPIARLHRAIRPSQPVEVADYGASMKALMEPGRSPAFETDVAIRRIGVADAPDLEAFYAALDPETRWLRFHAATSGLSHTQTLWFCRPDRDRHEGFVAIAHDPKAKRDRIVGHLCVEPESSAQAEIALVVDPEFQGRGIGRAMVRDAVAWARRDGIRTLTASMLVGNEPIRRLLTSLELPTSWTALGAGTCALAIDLTSTPIAPRAAA